MIIQLRRKFTFNKKAYSCFIATVLSIFFSFFGNAQEISSFNHGNIGKQLLYLEDKNGVLSLNDVQKLSDNSYKKGEQEILNFGNTSSVWWIKVNYLSKPNLPLHLIIDAPHIEYITAYTTDFLGNLIKYHTGSLEKKSPNVIIKSNFLLNLPISNVVAPRTVYLKLKSNNILLVPIKLSTSNNLIKQPLNVEVEYIYIGLLLGLLLYNLFLFLSIKDITYLYYVLYIFTLSSYILMYLRGYSFLLGDDLRIIFNEHPHVFMGLSLVTLLLFSIKFLNIEITAPKFKKIFYLLGVFGIVLIITSLLGYKSLSSSLTQGLSFVTALMVWIAGFIAFKNGHKPAKYFIIAWTLIWFSTIIVTFSLAGIIVQNDFTIQLVPLSSIIELLLLSFALGDRYKLIMQTEQSLRDENLLLVKTQNQRLEEHVIERTKQLSITVQALEESDTIKNKLFSIIAHDLKSPLNSLMGILSLNDMEALTSDELRMLLADNKKTFDSINNTLNNLLHWAKGQMNGVITEDTNFDLSLMLEELIFLYLPLIKNKDIKLEMNLETQSLVVADPNQINLVLRNLIDNAIKFTPIGGKIIFYIQPLNEEITFSIENEIQENQEVNLANLKGEKIATSTFGTQNESGVGLGLLLCHEYIKKNGSVLHTDIKKNRLKFSFSLPLANKASN